MADLNLGRPGLSILPLGVGDAFSAIHHPTSMLVSRYQTPAWDDDLILIDCPPLTPVADTHIIGEVVDASVLVVRAGSTPKDVLEQALTQYGKEKFFAAVLNRARPRDIPYFRDVYGYYRREPYVRKGRKGRKSSK